MLAESGLPLPFWGAAPASFVHISNCLPTASILKQTTPYQLWHGRKPDVAPFCIWGCLAYVHVQKDKSEAECAVRFLASIFLAQKGTGLVVQPVFLQVMGPALYHCQDLLVKLL